MPDPPRPQQAVCGEQRLTHAGDSATRSGSPAGSPRPARLARGPRSPSWLPPQPLQTGTGGCSASRAELGGVTLAAPSASPRPPRPEPRGSAAHPTRPGWPRPADRPPGVQTGHHTWPVSPDRWTLGVISFPAEFPGAALSLRLLSSDRLAAWGQDPGC